MEQSTHAKVLLITINKSVHELVVVYSVALL